MPAYLYVIRWGVQDRSGCKLRFYKSEAEEEVLGELDIQAATFIYNAEDMNGHFKIWSVEMF